MLRLGWRLYTLGKEMARRQVQRRKRPSTNTQPSPPMQANLPALATATTSTGPMFAGDTNAVTETAFSSRSNNGNAHMA
jgi:hypothetical protein